MKKRIIISSIAIFLLSSLIHSVYDIFPNTFTQIFFPINESIWEHNKMIVLAFLIWSIFDKYLFKKKNVLFSGIISALICCSIVLLVFSPIYFYILNTNDNLIITLIIYFIAIVISQIFKEKYLSYEYNTNLNYIGLFLWILVFIINGVLTFNPLDLGIFIDYSK